MQPTGEDQMPALSFSTTAASAKPDVKVTRLCRLYLLLVLQEKHPSCFSGPQVTRLLDKELERFLGFSHCSVRCSLELFTNLPNLSLF